MQVPQLTRITPGGQDRSEAPQQVTPRDGRTLDQGSVQTMLEFAYDHVGPPSATTLLNVAGVSQSMSAWIKDVASERGAQRSRLGRCLEALARKMGCDVFDALGRLGGAPDAGNEVRLTEPQQIAFLHLVRTPEGSRTLGQLFDAGVLCQPEWVEDDALQSTLSESPEAFEPAKSDAFLRAWLRGDIDSRTADAFPERCFACINLRSLALRDRDWTGVSFVACDLRDVQFDLGTFEDCRFQHSPLAGATMLGARFLRTLMEGRTRAYGPPDIISFLDGGPRFKQWQDADIQWQRE